MVLISGEKVFTKVITWRRDKDFHFSPKGENGAQNAICPSGVKGTIVSENLTFIAVAIQSYFWKL